MKSILALGVALFSIHSFAQSYLILDNGVTLTTNKAGKVLDLEATLAVSKVSQTGGAFFLEDGKLVVVAENGFLYRKDTAIKAVKGKGQNYLITDAGEIIIVDSQGFVYKYAMEASLLKKVNKFGGNYFAIEDKAKKETTLFTVSSKGTYSKITLPKVKTQGITLMGGNFFTIKDGTLHTVSKDGFVFSKADMLTDAKLSGNYFVTAEGALKTVTDDGFLLPAVTPDSFDADEVAVFGSNFMINTKGKIFVMNSSGTLVENSSSHDALRTKHFSK